MNNDSSRLRHTQKEKFESEHQEQQKLNSDVKEFSSVEELLRYDAAQTEAPPAIAVKLSHSIANAPQPRAKSFWQRIFSRE